MDMVGAKQGTLAEKRLVLPIISASHFLVLSVNPATRE
jgi:hypothetical protein